MMKLSVEDRRWIKAIARRSMVKRGWSYSVAYRRAERAVNTFVNNFYASRTRIVHAKRETQPQLKAKRLVYEAETARIEQERERQRAIAVDLQPLFDAAGGRNKWVYQERLKGRTVKDIGEQLGYSWKSIAAMLASESYKRHWNLS